MVVEVSGCKNRAVCDDIQALEKMVTNLQCDAENERLIGVKAEKRVDGLWDIVHCLSCRHDCQGQHRNCAGWSPKLADNLLIGRMSS